jgi:hypothetical protein
MARTAKNLALGQLTTTTLSTIYTAPTGVNTTSSVLAFTNTTNNNIVIDVYHGDGTDYLQRSLTLPAGSGRERVYYGFQQRVINSAETIKIQADSSSAFNYTLSGSEVEL